MEKHPQIDHEHQSGYIGGILSEKVNWLQRQCELGSYGHLSKSRELTEYQMNPPVFGCIGNKI